MTTPSDKETSLEKDVTTPSLQPPPITSTSKAKDTKEEDFESFDLDHTFNIASDSDDKL